MDDLSLKHLQNRRGESRSFFLKNLDVYIHGLEFVRAHNQEGFVWLIFGLFKGDLSLSKVHVFFFQPDTLKSSCLQKIPIWRQL